MVSESAKQLIASELGKLRKLNGHLDSAKLTHARGIIKGLGGDDPDIALERLVDLVQEHTGDRDLEAALASFGWGVASETSLGRLSEYSERHFVDPRTVRRWTDAGIRKLTLLIIGSTPWIQPRARQIIAVDGTTIKLGLDIRTPPGFWMNAPELWVAGAQVDLGIERIASSPEAQRHRTVLAAIAQLEELPIDVRLEWGGEKYPAYETVVRGSPDVVVTSRLGIRDLRTSVSQWHRE